MIKTTCVISAALLLSFAAYGQGGPPPGPGGPHRGFGPGGPGGGPGGFGMHPGKVVTGAPYSATFTNQHNQALAGGNTISRTTTGTVARDSQGRTYEQVTVPAGSWGSQSTGPKTLTFISDPVAGYSYTLDSATMIATQRPLRTPPAGSMPPAGTRPPNPAHNNPNVAVTTATGGTYQTLSNIDTKTTTRTIPAGAMGNAQAITETRTVLYSTTLQIVVSATSTDPRNGQSVYALSGIAVGEPAATLFQIPSGYTVQPASEHGGPGRGRPHGPPPQQ